MSNTDPVLTINSRVMFPGTEDYEVVLEDCGSHVRVVYALNGGHPTTFFLQKSCFEFDAKTGLWITYYWSPASYTMRRPHAPVQAPRANGAHGSFSSAIRPGPQAPLHQERTQPIDAPTQGPSTLQGKFRCVYERRGNDNAESHAITVEQAASGKQADVRAREILSKALNVSVRSTYNWFRLVNITSVD